MPLILVPTPIGNLQDISLRALEELKSADLIACEDTRHSGVLLKHYGIDKPLLSYHQHNEKSRSDRIIKALEEGKRVALISDAGTPGMSDPGYVLIQNAIGKGHQVDALPGATAFVPAILMSGFDPHPFIFYGFLPDHNGDRRKILTALESLEFTIVFYMSPHKISKHLEDILEIWQDRQCALVREISKIHQETIRTILSELILRVKDGIKGELVLVIEGKKKQPDDENLWQEYAISLKEQGMSQKDVALKVCERFEIPKNKVKSWFLENL